MNLLKLLAIVTESLNVASCVLLDEVLVDTQSVTFKFIGYKSQYLMLVGISKTKIINLNHF